MKLLLATDLHYLAPELYAGSREQRFSALRQLAVVAAHRFQKQAAPRVQLRRQIMQVRREQQLHPDPSPFVFIFYSFNPNYQKSCRTHHCTHWHLPARYAIIQIIKPAAL